MKQEIENLKTQIKNEKALYDTQLKYRSSEDPLMQNLAAKIAMNSEKLDTLENENKTNLDNVNVGWFKRNKRKIVCVIGAVAIAAGALVSCANSKKNDSIQDKPGTSEKTFNEEKYNLDPLAGDTMVKIANGWVEEFAKNGYDSKKQTEAMSIAAISSTFGTGSMGADEFKDKLALGANFTTESAVLKQFDTFGQGLQQVIQSKGKIDYSKVINNKASLNMLERLQKVYVNEDNLSFEKQQEEYNKLVQEMIDHMNDYDMSDLYVMRAYVDLGSIGNYNGEDSDLIAEDTRQLWATSAYNTCCDQLENCAVDFDRTAEKNQSIDQTLKTYLGSYNKNLILDTHHEHIDSGDYYYSFNEINQKVLEHAKTVQVANIDIDKKAEQESIKKADQMGEKQGYHNLTDADRKVMKPDGTIPDGNHTVENKVGDTVSTGNVDKDGNKVDEPLEDLGKYLNQGITDRQNNIKKNRNDFPSNAAYNAYIQGWTIQDEMMKDIEDVYEEKTETKDEMTNQNTNTKPQQPAQKPSQPSTEKPQQPSKPEKEDVVDEKTETTETYYDEYYEDILNGTIEIENPTKGGKTR